MRVRTQAKRQAILDIAGPMFLAEGYGALSMASIAARVGGSKATLYGYFASKEDLFAAFVIEMGAQRFRDLEEIRPAGADLASSLAALGRVYLRLVLSPEILAISRLVIAEVTRFPEVGRIFFDIGPRRTVERMGAVLRALAELHRLPDLATRQSVQHFKALCDAGLYEERLWGVAAEPCAQDIEAALAAAVARFLAGYGRCRDGADASRRGTGIGSS